MYLRSMDSKRIWRIALILVVLTVNISCDQISKSIVRQHIEYNEHISFFNNAVTLTKIENKGAFLSVGNTMPQPFRLIMLTILPLLVMVVVLIYILRKKTLPYSFVIGICFIVGGGIGNIYDRIRYGSVTDFMHIDLGFFQTGIFNMADLSIMVGGILVLIVSYLTDRKGRYTEDHQME